MYDTDEINRLVKQRKEDNIRRRKAMKQCYCRTFRIWEEGTVVSEKVIGKIFKRKRFLVKISTGDYPRFVEVNERNVYLI